VTVNISSPNTKNLRQLQGASELDSLLGTLRDAQQRLADQHKRYVPVALKIAPDLDDDQIANVADALLRHKMDGVIATNTTISREAVTGLTHAEEAGGLSGQPVREGSTRVIRALRGLLGDAVPIIGVGGIFSGADAQAKIDAGANAAITQYFYNPDAYFHFVDAVRRLGVQVPITPGIMPIANFSQLRRFSEQCGAEIPRWISRKMQAYGDDAESVRAFGTEVVAKLCQRLIEGGAPGLHFYTLNLAKPTTSVLKLLHG